MYQSLKDFLEALETAGELHRVSARVSAELEISEIVDRQCKQACRRGSLYAKRFDPCHDEGGGAALLFENVEGSDFQLAINVFGSYRRMEMALGCDLTGGFEAIARRIGVLTKPQPPKSFVEMMAMARHVLPVLRTPPKRISRGGCQDVVKLTEQGEVDLLRLPIMKCWPLDGDPSAVGYDMTAEQAGTAAGCGRFITFAGMHTIHAEDAGVDKPSSHNIGMYRAQLIDRTHLAMHWHMHHDGASHWRSWKEIGRPMPIAICLGGESVLPYAATAPLPPGINELLMAGFLAGRGIPLVKARTVPLWVPANSEIVIEGYVNTECGSIGYDPRTGEELGPGAVFEGPFGDHTGYYSMPDRYPIVNVTAITHRKNAVYPSIIVGRPPQEDYYLGKATERIFLPLLQTLIPDIIDYHLPLFGCFHNGAFVQIRKSYPMQARRVMHAIWGAGQMAWTKLIVVVDRDVDVHDEEAVMRAVFERTHFKRDIELVNGPLDILDHAAPRLGAGHKLGIDATRKIPGEEVKGVRIRGEGLEIDVSVARELELRLQQSLIGSAGIADVIVPEYGGGRCVFAAINKQEAGGGRKAIDAVWSEAARENLADCVVGVDVEADLRDSNDVWFRLCANFDPGRDLVQHNSRVGLDGTKKLPGDENNGQPVRGFPPIIAMDDDTKHLVDRRWTEYGLPDS